MRCVKHVLIFIVILASINFAESCTFDIQDERGHCSSFNDLAESGSHPEWKKLNVVNSGNEPFSIVKKGSFNGFSNVNDLQVKGLANGIERDAWEGLNNLYELHLDNNKINVIPSDAFANLPCEVMYIFFCEVQELMPKSFNKLSKLRWVNMYGNNVTTIPEGVFTGTPITHLILRLNKIRHVAQNAFSDMENLYFLSLEENEISSFSSQLSIGFASKLTYFYINRNKLTAITRDMFTVMPNLQVLLININQIERFGDNVFRDLRQLSLVDMSNNRLEELQTNIFNPKGMKNLQILFIHDNKLSFLSTGILVRLPNLKKISVGGNPWQCPCWDSLDSYLINHNVSKLCDDVYKFGERPSCVYTELAPRDCIYDIENVRDIPKIFEEQLKEYSKLPPVCNIDGVEKPVLAA